MSEGPPRAEHAPESGEPTVVESDPVVLEADTTAENDAEVVRSRLYHASSSRKPLTPTAIVESRGGHVPHHHESFWVKRLKGVWGVVGLLFSLAWQGIKKAKDMAGGGGGGHGGGSAKKPADHGHGKGGGGHGGGH